MTKQEIAKWLAEVKRLLEYENEWRTEDDGIVEEILSKIPDEPRGE